MRTHTLHGPELLEDRLVPSFVGATTRTIDATRQEVTWGLAAAFGEQALSEPWQVLGQMDGDDRAMGPYVGNFRDKGPSMVGMMGEAGLQVGRNRSSETIVLGAGGYVWEAGSVMMHPGAPETVCARWTSPLRGIVELETLLRDANGDGGDGITYHILHRRGGVRTVLGQGVIENGAMQFRNVTGGSTAVAVEEGDHIELVVLATGTRGDPRNNGWDMTAVEMRVKTVTARESGADATDNTDTTSATAPQTTVRTDWSSDEAIGKAGIGAGWTVLYRETDGTERVVPAGTVPSPLYAARGETLLGVWVDTDAVVTAAKNMSDVTQTWDSGRAWESGEVALHPGSPEMSVLRWESPRTGRLSVDARIRDIAAEGGDGITYRFLHRRGETVDVVAADLLTNGSTSLQPMGGGRFDLDVEAGDILEVEVSARGTRGDPFDHSCDLTGISLRLHMDPPVEKVEMVRIVPSFTLAWHGDGVLLTYKHIPKEVHLVFSAYETHQVLTFAQGSGSRVIPLPWANGTRAAQVRPVWAETGSVVRLGVAGPSFLYDGYECPRDLALGMSVEEAAYDIVQGTDPDAWVQAMTYTHVTLGREVAEHFAAVAVERAGLLFPSNRDMLALKRPDLFGRTQAEDEAHLLNLAEERSARNGTQRGYEQDLLRNEIKNLTAFLEQAKNMGWPMLMKEVENAFGMVLSQKIGLPWTGGPMLPRQNGDGIVFEYLLRKLPDGSVRYVHDEASVRAAVEAHFEELYALHVHFRREDAEIQEREANLRQIAEAVAEANDEEASDYASRQDLLAAIERAVQAGRLQVAAGMRMMLGVFDRVATAGSNDGGAEIGGIRIHENSLHDSAWEEVMGIAESSGDAVWKAVQQEIATKGPEASYQRLAALYNPEGRLQHNIGGRDVRVDTVVGQLFAGLAFNLRAQVFSTEERFRLCLAVEDVLGISAARLRGLCRIADAQRFTEALFRIFQEYRYDILRMPTHPRDLGTTVEYDDVKGMVRLRFNPALGSKAPTRIWAQLIGRDAAGKPDPSKVLGGSDQRIYESKTGQVRFAVEIPADRFQGAISDATLKTVMWFTGDNDAETAYSMADSLDWGRIDGMKLTILPESNRKVVDYLKNILLPTLEKISETEWKSPEIGNGGNCKVWVQTKLMEAVFTDTQTRPKIPLNKTVTDSNGSRLNINHQWEEGDDIMTITSFDKSSYSSETVKNNLMSLFVKILPGDLMQMEAKLSDGTILPHTAVFDTTDENGVWVFDSNWNDPMDATVRWHHFSWDKLSNLANKMTIYRINQ